MRKVLYHIALGLCLLTLLVGCAAQPGQPGTNDEAVPKVTGNLSPSTPVTVTLWHYYVGENKRAIETAVSSFNQTLGLEKGVVVDAVGLGSIAELEAAVTESAMGVINAEPMPQIFSSYSDKAMEIDKLGKVVDLNAYFTDEDRGAFIEDLLKDGIFDGSRLLVLPIVKSTEIMYVNDTDWKVFAQANGYEADSLKTWESVYDVARAYYQWTDGLTPEVPWDGKTFMGFDSVANYVIVGSKQMGIDIIHATGEGKGEAILDEASLRRIFDLYYPGMSLGYFGAYGKFRSDDIKAGMLVAYVGSTSSAAYFPTWIEVDNAQQPIDFLPIAYPVFEGGTPYAIQQGAGMCVAKGTPAQQEGAVLFLKWFTQSENNINFSMTTGYLPVQSAAYSSDAFSSAVATLREGSQAQQNVAGVYEMALYQVTQTNTYAARPFQGSYDVRSILQTTLIAQAESSAHTVRELKAQGLDEAAILEALNLDEQFAQWLASIEEALGALEIPSVRQ